MQQLARAEVLRGESLPTALAHVRSALPAPGGARDFWDVFTVTSLHFCGERTEAMTLADEIIAAGQARGDTQTRKIALAVREILSGAGLPNNRFVSVVGRADTEPLFVDNPYIPPNRRVTITLLNAEPPLPPGASP